MYLAFRRTAMADYMVTESMLQQEDQQFAHMLMRVRTATCTE